MKVLDSVVTNQGNVSGAAATMSVDPENWEHLMGVLTNLYSDKFTAVIREYSTNAYDAHVEAGIKRPIRIGLPTKLSPTLEIEDFGVGMTTDELLNLYSQYGTSTKRGTNEQTGMLGIGSKSGLAVASQFTIRSRKGGVETSALIYLNERGVGEIRIVDTRSTNETGTLISIPVAGADVKEINAKATKFFTFWEPGTFEGVQVKRKDWVFISPSIALAPRGSFRKKKNMYGWYESAQSTYFVQGNVPYAFDDENANEHIRNVVNSLPTGSRDIIFFAPIGSLQFTPSREDLYYTKHTIKQIEKSVGEYHKAVGDYVSQMVNKAVTKREAMGVVESWAEFIRHATVTYKGETVPNSIKVHCYEIENRKNIVPSMYSSVPNLSKVDSFDLVVHSVPSGTVTGKSSYTVRRALSAYFGHSGLAEYYSCTTSQVPTKTALIFTGPLPENWEWTGKKAISWDEFSNKTTKVSKRQGEIDYVDRTWDLVGGGTAKIKSTDGEGVIVTKDAISIPAQVRQDFQCILVKANQFDKFRREFPKAMTFFEYIENEYERVKHLDVPVIEYAEQESLVLKHTQVLDKRLARVLELAEQGKVARSSWGKAVAHLGRFAPRRRNGDPNAASEWKLAVGPYEDIIWHLSASRQVEVINALYTYEEMK